VSVYVDLAAAWMRVGLFGFGGGNSVIPLVRYEVVERHGWMTDEAFLEALALGNTLPGPIAVKLAADIGLRVGGALGSVVALAALNLPAIALMLLLASAYTRYREHPGVLGALAALRPALIGLLVWAVCSMVPDAVRDLRGAGVAVAAFVALQFNVHPVLVLGGAIMLGALWR